MRTIFYHFILVGTFLYGMIFRAPTLLFKKGRDAHNFARKVGTNWGKNLVWASGSKVKVIYENDCEKEIKKIKETGEPIILISNHQSNLDIPTLLGYLPLDFAFIAKKEMKNWPLIGGWMKALNCIFLDRKNARQGMKDMKNAISKVEDGYSYVIFPEGSRTENGEVEEFKKGSFKLAKDSKVRILPLTICGTYEVQSKKSLKVKGNKNIKVIVDKPIDLTNLPIQEQKNIHKIVNDIIRENLKKYKM